MKVNRLGNTADFFNSVLVIIGNSG